MLSEPLVTYREIEEERMKERQREKTSAGLISGVRIIKSFYLTRSE